MYGNGDTWVEVVAWSIIIIMFLLLVQMCRSAYMLEGVVQ